MPFLRALIASQPVFDWFVKHGAHGVIAQVMVDSVIAIVGVDGAIAQMMAALRSFESNLFSHFRQTPYNYHPRII